ncbi:hypothetical protein [Candidatus Magnetominusculus dajiuhuensis]|uniref:hypothetical protein n=1 Tax=Candidatus Magnetominusculus dajiuhuensis TaxID=3137712 RepID=UPI003B4286D5
MPDMWKEILRREVTEKGSKAVGIELGYSRSVVDLVLRGTYNGNLANVEARVMSIYGNNGQVICPIKGGISPAKCIETWQMAKAIGMKASNPETLRLYKACEKCAVRK